MICFDEPFLTIHVVSDGNIIWAEWKGTGTQESVDRAFTAGVKALVENNSSNWLADTRRFATTDPLLVKWVNDTWVPRFVGAGVRKMAVVAPEKVIMQIQVRSFMARIDGRELETSYFGNIDDAWAWLRAKP